LTDSAIREGFLRIGTVSAPHGFKGLVRVSVVSDIPERFAPGNTVLLEKESGMVAYKVSSSSLHKARTALVQFEGIDDRNGSESIVGCDLYISRETADKSRGLLSDSEFYYFDLIGSAVHLDGSEFGKVRDVIEGGSGHILEIADSEGSTFLVPFVEEMVDTSRIKEGHIDIHPVPGLLEK
jgi:16S rRNA processing protein RimM